MTSDEARAILTDLPSHDDATIRDAAALLMSDGTAEDIQRARRLVAFGQKHGGQRRETVGR